MVRKAKFYSKEDLEVYLDQLRALQRDFMSLFGVDDVFSNSKVYEVIIAHELAHKLIPGHSGSRDALDESGGEMEYKHYKKSSTNHSWTFNDYTDTTIRKLATAKAVIFAYIEDDHSPPNLGWYISVPGAAASAYLEKRTKDLLTRKPKGRVNSRRMINITPGQLETDLGVEKVTVSQISTSGPYSSLISGIYEVTKSLETITGVKNILTSNKIWEVLVSIELGHSINPEQGGRVGSHDAIDRIGDTYEYKVSKSSSWQFQDISPAVLKKYLSDKAVILAVVDKQKVKVISIHEANPERLVKLLRKKLEEKSVKYAEEGKEVRRLQISLSMKDLKSIGAKTITRV